MRRLFVREEASERVRDEMKAAVRLLALPLPEAGEYVETSIGRVARNLGLDWGEVKALWYRERKVIPTELSDFLRAEVELRRSDSETSEPSVTEQSMPEFDQLRERLDALEAMIKGQNDANDLQSVSQSGQRVLPRAGQGPGRRWRTGTSAPATA